MKTGIYGDMFIVDRIIFRIYNNIHPKNHYIAYPIYKIDKNKIIKIKSTKYIKKYLAPVGKGINIPFIPRKKVTQYFSCFDLNLRLTGKTKKEFEIILQKLRKIGIKNIGLTGSTYLKGKGFKKDFSKSDLDFIIYGKKESKILMNKLSELHDKDFHSYKFHPKKIYHRRKYHSTPFFIDYFTAKEFETSKPQGILNGTHINITPTMKIKETEITCKNKIELMGLKKFRIKILEDNKAQNTPAQYSVKDMASDKEYILYTNIFYYCFGKKGNIFNIECEEIKNNNKVSLSLEGWGNFRKYRMNLIKHGK